jgi:uncharacterized protein with HEPN domain
VTTRSACGRCSITREAVHLTAGKSVDDVLRERVLGLRLIRLVEVFGEAASRVTPATRAAHPQIAWRQAIDTRNRLIHGYDTVNLPIVVRIIRDDLPQIVAELESILAQKTDS